MKQVRPKKNLGQHFLTDLSIAKRIADTVDEPYAELPVLEVGPGMGVMTQFLVEKPRPLKVVEIDRESVAFLSEKYGWTVEGALRNESRRDSRRDSRSEECGVRSENTSAAEIEKHGNFAAEIEKYGDSAEEIEQHGDISTGKSLYGASAEESRVDGNLTPHSTLLTPRKNSTLLTPRISPRISPQIISGDFLRMDLNEVFDGQQFVLTGNYPYDISSQIFFKMLDNKDLIPCCTGMIQHEVAVRMASQPGNKQYGILSVLIQAWYNVEYLFTVEPSVFNPPPKVQSAVIRMTRNAVTDLGCDEQLFRRVVKTTFNQRRKMLRVSLRQLLSPDQLSTLNSQFSTLLARRPEQLSIPEFVELTNKVAAYQFQ